MDWKQRMFSVHAELFLATLRTKRVPQMLGGVISTFVPQVGKQRTAILDLGCGSGRLTQVLAECSSYVVGVDLSLELLQEAVRTNSNIPNAIFMSLDFRNISTVFLSNTFDLIIRAYTSLGYFSYNTEVDILSQASLISSSRGVIIVDTFNASYFLNSRVVERETMIDLDSEVTLTEVYSWNPLTRAIDCKWSYANPRDQIACIDFILDGYDKERVAQLLQDSGWRLLKIAADFDGLATPLTDVTDSERLVIVAEKIV